MPQAVSMSPCHPPDNCHGLLERAKALLPAGDDVGRYILDMALTHLASGSAKPRSDAEPSPDQRFNGGSPAIA